MNLHDVRRDYHGQPLPDLTAFDPWTFFAGWVQEAVDSEDCEPTAMTLSTVDATGVPQARVVLLKDYIEGLTFFTSYLSAKARELDAHPACSGLFWWPQVMRQVRAAGVAARLPRGEVEAYFATRPRASQIGAWASRQSEPLTDRAQLEAARAEAERRFEGREVECPPYWGGYRITVTSFEFWQGQSGRIHDRVLSRLRPDGLWESTRLHP